MTDGVKPAATKKRPVVRAHTADAKPLPSGAATRMNARVVLVFALLALALWTAAGFPPALVWATILAVSLWPLYIKFAARLPLEPRRIDLHFDRCARPVHADVACRLPGGQQGDVLVGWMKKAGESGMPKQ